MCFILHLTLKSLKVTQSSLAAYYAESDACKRISKASAACLNGISGEALTIYDMRGYKSPLEKVLMTSRMDYETLNAMFSAIKESLPVFHEYYHKKAKRLRV